MSDLIDILNTYVPAISLLALFLSIVNTFLFFKILKKFDDSQLDFIKYINEVGNERLTIYKHIDNINKQIRLYGNEVKKRKKQDK